MNPSDLIFIIQDEIIQNPSHSYFVKLKHPRSGQSCLYVWKSDGSGRLFEVQRVSEKHRSWFLGSKIKSDGGAYLCTPVDLLFLIIPVLREQNRFTTVHGLLANSPELMTILDEGSPQTMRLSSICDSKVVGEHTVFRYNESLTLAWLTGRIEAVSRALLDLTDPDLVKQVQLLHVTARTDASTTSDKEHHGTADARAPAFTSDSVQAQLLTGTTLHPDICRQFAFQLVADYLPPDLTEKLRAHIKLDGPEQRVHIDSPVSLADDVENLDPGRHQTNHTKSNSLAQPTEDYSTFKSEATPGRPEPVSKKAKYAKGIQSITSFFGKRST